MSVYFDSTDFYYASPLSDLSTYTITLWAYQTDAVDTTWAMAYEDGGDYHQWYNNSGFLAVYTGSNYNITTDPDLNAWAYLCFMFSGGVCYSRFANLGDTAFTSGNADTSPDPTGAGLVTIGGSYDGNYPSNAYIVGAKVWDGVRLSDTELMQERWSIWPQTQIANCVAALPMLSHNASPFHLIGGGWSVNGTPTSGDLMPPVVWGAQEPLEAEAEELSSFELQYRVKGSGLDWRAAPIA